MTYYVLDRIKAELLASAVKVRKDKNCNYKNIENLLRIHRPLIIQL